MLKMTSQIETIVNAYKTVSKIPFVVGGKLSQNGTKVSVKWSVRNLDRGKATKYLYNYTLDDKLNVIAQSDFGVDISNELLSAVSPKETYKAIIREEKDKKDKKRQYLEVWEANRLAHSMDLTALEQHGDVYADAEFGCLNWSQDESSIVYVAEKKRPKLEPYIMRKAPKGASPDDGKGEKVQVGEEYVYRQDWGEQLVGKYLSVVVVCHLETETLTVLDGLPQSWCPGQVSFTPDGKSVVGVAWETEPRRLGLIFCTNRPSFIFTLTLDGVMKKLSTEGMAVRSPRITPNGEKVLWLQRKADGPHHACHAVVAGSILGQDPPTTIIDIVNTEIQTSNNKSFFGLYCQQLPKNCFSKDGRTFVFSTQQQTEVKSYVAYLDGSKIIELPSPLTSVSVSVLDVKENVILASCTSITRPAQLYIAFLPSEGFESAIVWKKISKPIAAPSAIASATVEYLHLQHENDDDVKSFTAIYTSPTVEGGGKLPLIVWPHGGPHSAFVNAFSLEAALFAMLGFATIQVNYRGSVGNGQKSVYYLLNKAGDKDVVDCKMATDEAIKRFNVDPTRIFLTGGSHGGFLVTHLSGQYPETYRAVVSRNPVIDVATMFNTTDIADWCAVEAGFDFTEAGAVSEEHLLAMRRCSPLAHVHKVKAPTALMLGSVDKRVPYYQGLEYYRRLRANGVEARLFMYEDNHSLSTLPAEMDNLINGAHWFLQHL